MNKGKLPSPTRGLGWLHPYPKRRGEGEDSAKGGKRPEKLHLKPRARMLGAAAPKGKKSTRKLREKRGGRGGEVVQTGIPARKHGSHQGYSSTRGGVM